MQQSGDHMKPAARINMAATPIWLEKRTTPATGCMEVTAIRQAMS